MNEPALGQVEPLPSGIDLLPGTDLDALWEPFRFFEAGHHLMDIMNPLSSDGLDGIVAAIDRQPAERLLDIACGHGELLLRVAASSDLEPPDADGARLTGVDLSPWTLRRAHDRLDAAKIGADLVLGDGARYVDRHTDRMWDVITLIGASWIWGGFEPSVGALVRHLGPGGRLAIGEVVASSPEARDRLAPVYGTPPTGAELRAALERAGLIDLTVIPTTGQDWRDYDDRVMHGIRQWLQTFPDDRGFLRLQEEYEAVRADPADVTWQVWIGTAPPAPVTSQAP